MSKNYVPEQLHLIPGIETCCMVSKYRESANLKLKHSEEVYGKLIDHIHLELHDDDEYNCSSVDRQVEFSDSLAHCTNQ